MNEEKLEKASSAVWRELNLQLLKRGCAGLNSYVKVIINLLDSTFSMYAKGDKTERIRLYELLSKCLNNYIEYLKGNYEIQREG